MPIDMVQEFRVEVDSPGLLERYFRLAAETALNSCDVVAARVVTSDLRSHPSSLPSSVGDPNKHFPVILVSGWYAPSGHDGGLASFFNGQTASEVYCASEGVNTIDAVWSFIDMAFKEKGQEWGREFREKFGDGYDDWFNQYDGSVGIGYVLMNCMSMPEQLAIGLVHIYYGK